MRARLRRAFTLGEVLISIAIIAVLAALTVPTVANQISKGEPTRVSNDLFAIRGAMQGFVADVGRYPGAVDQLIRTITTSNATTPYLLGSSTSCASNCLTYGQSDVLHWHGPYLTKDTAFARVTGYGYTIDNAITAAQMGATGYDPTSGAQMWAILTIQSVDTLDWLAIDKLFDDGVATTGLIRWESGGTTPKMLKFLALPVQ